MAHEITLRIILDNPTPEVVYGIQKGKGNNYETVQKQQSDSGKLIFEINVEVKINKDGSLTFAGPYTQGNPKDRFIYLDIGTAAGQINSPWSRRLKIPLSGITRYLTHEVNSQMIFQTNIAGRGKDGSPNCGTVKPFEGWKLL